MKNEQEIIDSVQNQDETSLSSKPHRPLYAGLTDRIKAVTADGFFLVVCMFIISSVFTKIGDVSDTARMFAFISIFLLYDPLFTSVFGGTIGHFAMGLRVKRENDQNKNIYIHLAFLRFIAKALLGWISILTVMSSEKNKAIHDMIAQSVVVHVKKD